MAFTNDFVSAAVADVREPKARVEVTWAESAVDTNAVITSNDINRIDRTGQVVNGKTESGDKWAYLHTGLLADGTFKACPELDTEPQMGWYGTALVSDVSGDFSTEPYIQIAHDARSYTAITVAGDSEYNEYPVDFDITITHPGGPTVISVTGNTQRVYTTTFTAIVNATAIKLEISKWSAASTIVKLTQFSGSLTEVYKGDDIVGLTILEETNSDTGVVPIGNVSSNELDLTLMNTDRRFSYGNTDSQYLTSLKSGRKIRVWLGFVLPAGSADVTGDVTGYIVETESGNKVGYMPYGVYWSKDWVSSYESMETTTTAYDVVYLLSQKEFLKSDNYSGTVQSIVDEVLTEALEDVPDLQWAVSADTASVSWDDAAFEPTSYLAILKEIAEATLSYTYVDRNGLLVVGSLLEADTPLASWQEIDQSDYYNYESNPKLDELVNRIRVGYTKYTVGTPASSIYPADEVFAVPISGSATFNLRWSPAPVDVSTILVTITPILGAPVISSIEKYAYGATITVSGLFGGTFQLSATGTPYELEENTETTADNAESIALYGVREFALTGNMLVSTVTQAQSLANSLLSRYGNLRQDGSLEWPVSTLLSVGDTLEVVEFKSDTVETKDNFLIKRQSIKYDGAMQGGAELRRG